MTGKYKTLIVLLKTIFWIIGVAIDCAQLLKSLRTTELVYNILSIVKKDQKQACEKNIT